MPFSFVCFGIRKKLLVLGTFFCVTFSFGQLDVEHFIPPMHARISAGNHYLVLGTPVATSFSVTVTDGAGNVLTTIPISNGISVTTLIGSNYTSPFMVGYGNLNTVLNNSKGLILKASQPFYANIRATVNNQAGSLTSKGISAAKGKDFWTGHMYNNSAAGSYKSSCFSFMATENNTKVTISNIHAGVVLEGVAPGTSTISVQLNKGESYVVSNYMDNPQATNNTNGLNGTHITSDKDVVVNCGTWLGGNSISGTSPSGTSQTGKDIGMDQIVPVDKVGTEYVLIKGLGVDNERTVVVASQNNTQLFFNGSGTASATLNAGDYYVIYGSSFSANNNLFFTSSAPVFVTQTINAASGYTTDNEHCGGMNFIPPALCTGSKEVFIPNVQFLGSAYIQIIADAGAVIQANGLTISGAQSIVGTSDYVTYSLTGYSGDVSLTSTLPIRVALINGSGNIGAAGYFSGFSKEISLSATYLSNGFVGDEEIMEGCGVATVTIERLPYFADEVATITLQVSGSATEGVDYSDIPNQLILATGQTQVSFPISAFTDGLGEGSENVVITLFLNGNHCGESELGFTIRDVSPLQISLADKQTLCLGDSLWLEPRVTGGVQPYSFAWSSGETTNDILVDPIVTTEYFFTVTDLCLIDTAFSSTIVIVPDEPLVAFAGLDTAVLCPYTPLAFEAIVQGGLAPYTYQWDANGTPVSLSGSFIYEAPVTTELILTVWDFCKLEAYDTLNIEVAISLMDLTVNEDKLICPFEEVELWGEVTGGWPPYVYSWDHSSEIDSNVWVQPEFSTTYTLHVSDQCQTYELFGHPYVKVIKPLADFEVLSQTQVDNLPVSFENTSVGADSWAWDFGNGDVSNLFAPQSTFLDDGTYVVQLIVTNEIGCVDTVVKQVLIQPEFYFYAPNTFTPDGNQFNNNYAVSVIGALAFEFNVFNRWGELVFQSKDPDFEWDGACGGRVVQDGVYIYTAVILGEDNETRTYKGHINLLR